jgi:mannonate dehydratase
MKLASVLNPLSGHNLALAAQTGVEEIVIRGPGSEDLSIAETQARVESFGMKVGVVEGGLPIDRIKLGQDNGSQLAEMKELIRMLGDLGIPIVCYNFMAGTDWIRTSVDARDRGGALVTAFDIDELENAQIPGRDKYGDRRVSC